MKQLFLTLVLGICMVFAFGASPPAPELVPVVVEQLNSLDPATPVIDTATPESLISYWEFLYVLLMPVGNYLLARFWPSNTKQALTLKTSIFALTILIGILSVKGWTLAIIIKAVTLFVGQAMLYDKVLNPIGLKTHKGKS